ncbi:MAG: AraC family transcriptional regulator [Microvirga sp.]
MYNHKDISAVIDPRLEEIEEDSMRTEAWIQVIAPIFIAGTEGNISAPKDALFRCYNLGRFILGEFKMLPHELERTQTQIRTQCIDHVILILPNSGHSSIEYYGRKEAVPTGCFLLLDLSQPARIFSANLDGLKLFIPRRLFDAQVGDVSTLHQQVFGGGPLFTLLAEYVRGLRDCLETSSTTQKSLLASATMDLANAAFAGVGDSSYNAPAVAGIEILQFIERELSREDLSAELLSARFGVSQSTMYALFEPDGGVMTYIRHRRLARAMRILSGVEGEGPHRVSAVAYACGYTSPKMFSKAFHARYGVVPRDVDTTFKQQAYQEAGAQLLSWIREL